MAVDVRQEIAERYPAFVWLFDSNPEIAGLLERAVNDKWSAEQFQARLYATNWWKQNSESMRQWDTLVNTDNATAAELLKQTDAQLRDMAAQMGAVLNDSEYFALAANARRFGWNDSQIRDALASHIRYRGRVRGDTATNRVKMRQLAHEYAVPISSRNQETWLKKLAAGDLTMDGIEQYFREQARSMYPALVDAINRGVTVRQYAEPYIQIAAQELEIDPDNINLSDPKWSTFLNQVDPKTGEKRAMTLDAWQARVRSDRRYGWDTTSNARKAAAELSDQLLTMFGAK